MGAAVFHLYTATAFVFSGVCVLNMDDILIRSIYFLKGLIHG